MKITDTQMQILDFSSEKISKWEEERRLCSVHFELTPKCNFKCIHCYLQHVHSETQLSFERIIDILDILYDQGVLFITFTGGEIFLRDDFLDIYMYAKKRGFLIELFTNASLINDQAIKIMAEYPPILVDVSLYGACEETYKKITGISNMFDKVISNCRKMVDYNIRIALKSPILTLSFPEIEEMKEIAKSMSVPFRASFDITPTIENDMSTKAYQIPYDAVLKYEYDDFIDHEIKESVGPQIAYSARNSNLVYRCKIGKTSCVIDYNGRLCPCMKLKHKGVLITKESFSETWNGFTEIQGMKASSNYKCIQCPAYDYCDICPAEMESLYGSAEYIDDAFCKVAFARKRFHETKEPPMLI